MAAGSPPLPSEPLWYRDAVIYQLHVKAFADGNGDGVGDFAGLTSRLDYVADLGVTALWLLPFYPSPLRDDGYDIADYLNVHPSYGTLGDFKRFLREAHARGLRVITELVLNHTSSSHPWFARARAAKPGSTYRDFYVWSDTAERYREARIIFQDFEESNWTWDPIAQAYYWHRFYAHQPDLNFRSPHVRRAMTRALDHWFGMGVDGVRLDAVPYLYEREGTNCENLPETHGFLKELRTYVDRSFSGKMLLAEANQWPEDAQAYFGQGDECHMAFHFPVMPRLFMALEMEDRFPILDILQQTPSIPESCQWAMFLRNHDELTLEMVTDEERDYMYRAYARDRRARINLGIRRRLAPLMGNSRRRIELMNFLLFSLPGAPVLYYGDEIGMGDNFYLGDRDGVRTPMQWSSERNAGFSGGSPQRLYLPVVIDPEYHYEAVNVETQNANPSSLLWWMRRTIEMRRRYRSFSRGSLDFVSSDNPKVLSFVRQHDREVVLVVVNLSRFFQVVELELSAWEGRVPEEVFSRNMLPRIREERYLLTLDAHEYHWFRLTESVEGSALEKVEAFPELSIDEDWEEAFEGENLRVLEETILPEYLKGQPWFRGKSRVLREVRLADEIPAGGGDANLTLWTVSYADGADETYSVPIACARGEHGRRMLADAPGAVVARLRTRSGPAVLYDALHASSFRGWLLEVVAARRKISGLVGELAGVPAHELLGFGRKERLGLTSRVLGAERSNTSVAYEPSFFLKLYRGLEEGLNPDPELTRFLTEKKRFAWVPPYAGSLEYRRPGAEPLVLGMVQRLVAHQGDAWSYTLDTLGRYFERVLSGKAPPPLLPSPLLCVLQPGEFVVPPEILDLITAPYLEMVRLLAKRTAQMHLAFLSGPEEEAFRPEEWSTLYQRSVYHGMRARARGAFEALRRSLSGLSEPTRARAERILAEEEEVLQRLQRITGAKIPTVKTRVHGDYDLEQVLYTGKDFYIIDFEGEPARALSERRLKRSPFRDVAGMVRSFHYAVHTAQSRHPSLRSDDAERLEPWMKIWFRYVSSTFVRSYLSEVGGALFVPPPEALERMLAAFLLDQAVHELGYELANRPAWVYIPLRGIEQVLDWTK